MTTGAIVKMAITGPSGTKYVYGEVLVFSFFFNFKINFPSLVFIWILIISLFF